MKVLWFSNCVLGNSINKGSGSWLFAMSKIICDSVELINATLSSVEQVTYNNYGSFSEVLIPSYKLKDGIPEEKNICTIQETIENINPDIIHIWGLESFWGSLYAKGYIKGKVILEVQGLMKPCYEVFWAGLNPFSVVMKTLCVRDIVYPNSRLLRGRKAFKFRSQQSEYVLSNCNTISTQSRWVRDQIKFLIGKQCKVYNTLRPIRQEFWDASPWQAHRNSCRIFTSMSYYLPFKGIHVLIQAVALLKQKYSNVLLEIAGVEEKDTIWYRQFAYIKLLIKLAKKMGVIDNVKFVGRLSASEIICHLHACDVFVNPSFVESYSASTAEALAVGVPTVVAYSGAMPDFSVNKKVSLYYSPMDYADCAAKITTMIENDKVRNELTENAKNEVKNLCGSESVKKVQLAIYNEVLKNE